MARGLRWTRRRGRRISREFVRGSVEATLNRLLDAEAERLCNARRYERTEGRRDTRAGHYERSLHTKAGPVQLKVPKLRHLPLSDGDHRALPPTGELGRGSAGGEVPRGGEGRGGWRTSWRRCGGRGSVPRR